MQTAPIITEVGKVLHHLYGKMISIAALRPTFVRTPAKPCATPAPRRAICKAIANPDDFSDREEDLTVPEKQHVNPATGNPQTGKLIDVYFEVGSLLCVVLLSFWSLWNVQGVLDQVGSADKIRDPAPRQEWLAMDTQNVYGPCGNASGHDDAIQDLLEGKPCGASEYNRLPPKAK